MTVEDTYLFLGFDVPDFSVLSDSVISKSIGSRLVGTTDSSLQLDTNNTETTTTNTHRIFLIINKF